LGLRRIRPAPAGESGDPSGSNGGVMLQALRRRNIVVFVNKPKGCDEPPELRLGLPQVRGDLNAAQ
jgi:hypothetical protein